jgi:hypothetical protein
MKSIRWICIQASNNGKKHDWFCEWTLSYTRTESIRLLTDNDTLAWRKLKTKHAWRWVKVQLTITEI